MAREYTRVYLEGGMVAHLLDELLSPNQANSAVCGRFPSWPSLWLGTGSQDEHERAEELRLCTQCVSISKDRDEGILAR